MGLAGLPSVNTDPVLFLEERNWLCGQCESVLAEVSAVVSWNVNSIRHSREGTISVGDIT